MTVGKGKASRYNRRIQIERPVTDSSLTGAGSGSWEAVGSPIAASVVDVLPSRAERLAGGINVATRPAKVRMRFRTDVTPSMRFVMTKPFPRVMQIIAGPAEVGVRDEVEFMVEDYSVAGNAA
ncbi:head-tail adaptor protein [Sphingomonas sp. Leaf30]|uniref:head-tail adaptor protein n=1 Tax=Sphingomonas sp. Leaf30 TaxID=1736213 RepID=UPI0006FCF1A2|nr:head-tail adaptor protein [Sphingomonas sp. Leaf30]KQN11562.1 phage head-tail adaptor protein [Sphingomonas sp. Leaf30]